MPLDLPRADQKRQELIELAQEAISSAESDLGQSFPVSDPRAAATAVVDAFIMSITPPEKPEVRFEMVTMRSGGVGGATSVKPGNLRLSLRKLVEALASGVLTAVGAASSPFLILLAAIVIWDRIWSELSIDLCERDAAVLWTLWINRDKKSYVSAPGLLDLVNSELRRHSQNPITAAELDASLATLQRMRCIEKSDAYPSAWWLREWVGVSYR